MTTASPRRIVLVSPATVNSNSPSRMNAICSSSCQCSAASAFGSKRMKFTISLSPTTGWKCSPGMKSSVSSSLHLTQVPGSPDWVDSSFAKYGLDSVMLLLRLSQLKNTLRGPRARLEDLKPVASAHRLRP